MDSSSKPTLSEISGVKHIPTGTQPQVEKDLLEYRDGGRKPLTGKEYKEAEKELIVTDIIGKFPSTYKYSVDPIYRDQSYCLHSFIPSKGATPDEDGVFGMIKLRGSFPSIQEMNERSEDIVRELDSYNKIFHGYTGRWAPITTSSKYTAEVYEVDLQEKIKNVVGNDIKSKRRDEEQEIKEIKDREKKLREDVLIKDEDRDPIERYLELMVKKAHCLYTLDRYKADGEKLQKVVDDTKVVLTEMNENNPEFLEKYESLYRAAREEVGMSEVETQSIINYMKI
jgi:hypothetical protein